MNMIHYTLNTGHSRVSPRSEVSAETIKLIKPLLMPGRNRLPKPMNDYALQVTIEGAVLMATLWDIKRPVLAIAVAPNNSAAETVWSLLEQHYYQMAEFPGFRSLDWEAAKKPASTPWTADLLILARPDESQWTGDFSRCLAWGWIEQQK